MSYTIEKSVDPSVRCYATNNAYSLINNRIITSILGGRT